MWKDEVREKLIRLAECTCFSCVPSCSFPLPDDVTKIELDWLVRSVGTGTSLSNGPDNLQNCFMN